MGVENSISDFVTNSDCKVSCPKSQMSHCAEWLKWTLTIENKSDKEVQRRISGTKKHSVWVQMFWIRMTAKTSLFLEIYIKTSLDTQKILFVIKNCDFVCVWRDLRPSIRKCLRLMGKKFQNKRDKRRIERFLRFRTNSFGWFSHRRQGLFKVFQKSTNLKFGVEWKRSPVFERMVW